MPDLVVGFRGRGLTRFVAGATGVINTPDDPGDPGDDGGVGPGPGPVAGWGGVQSPTGRNPLFIANSARQAVWNQMWTDYLAAPTAPTTRGGKLAKQVKEAAELGAGYYANIGQYATYMFQMTGDPAWAQLAYTQIQAWWLTFSPYPSLDVNPFRDWCPEHVIMLDWLWPGLTSLQRNTLYDSLVSHVNATISNYGGGWASFVTSGDSDQILGHYFSLVLLYLFDPTNTTIAALYNSAPTGTLDATATNHNSTARNAIKEYFVSLALGGEWIESSEYNIRTMGHNTIPVMEAVLTATGVEHFPEYRTFIANHALNLMAHWTPDLLLNYQWGDEENPYQPQLNDWANTCRGAAGVLQGTVAGEQLQSFVFEMEAKYGLENNTATSFEPFQPGRWFQTYNPYAPSQEWKTAANQKHYSSGKGILLYKSGYTTASSLFAVDSGQWLQDAVQGSWWVHHVVEYFMQFMLYKNGEWALKVPFGYNSIGVRGAGMNIPLMHGINMASEYKRVQHTVMDASYAYIVATMGGSMQDKFYDVPNALVVVHEWTRSLVFVPGLADVVVCYDRAYVTAISDIGNYRSQITIQPNAVRPRIEGGLAFDFYPVTAPLHRKQLILHSQVSPTIGGQEITWTTPGGQMVKATQLFPASTTKTIRSEAALRAANEYDFAGSVSEPTLAYHTIVYPTTTQDWDTFLQVIYAGGTPGVLVSKSNGGWEGVHGTRSEGDFLVLFNATQGATLNTTPYHASHVAALQTTRFRAVGCTIAWTAIGATTRVILNDLDPAHSWTINKDGAGAVSLSVDSGGHATYTVAGAGAHSLVLA